MRLEKEAGKRAMINTGSILAALGLLMSLTIPLAAAGRRPAPLRDGENLLVIWTSADREVALNMVYMYVFNAKKRGWWKNVRFLIWGPSARLLAEDAELGKQLSEMKQAGVELLACKACSDGYGVSEKLAEMGVEVKYMGVPLSEMLKAGWTTLSF